MPSQEDYLDQLLKEMESGLNDNEEESSTDIEFPKIEAPEIEAPEIGTSETETPMVEIPKIDLAELNLPDDIAAELTEFGIGDPEADKAAVEEPDVDEPIVIGESESVDDMIEVPADFDMSNPETDGSEADDPEAAIQPVEAMPAESVPAEEEADAAEPDASDESFDMSDMDELLQFARTASDEEDEEESGDVMSEEEIEKLLNQNRITEEDASNGADSVPGGEEDLMSLLDAASSDSDDLQDIQDMLQKSDHNEAVDASVLEQAAESLNPWENGMPGEQENPDGEDEFAGMSERQKKALLKKREKEEKAARKKAEKEAKKAEKLAKKAEKEAAKKQPKEEKAAPAVPEADTTAGQVEKAEEAEFSQAEIDALLGGETLGAEPESDPLVAELAEIPEKDAGKDSDKKGKKSLLARIIEFLTEEDEEEEEKGGIEDIPLSDENKNILEEMDQEEKGKKGKKGKKPKKDKKGKDAKAADGDEDEEGGSAKGKEKKKPKKEKKPKPVKEKEPVDPKNKITLKKLLPVILAGVSLLLVLILLVHLGGDFVVKKNAKRAFYQEDYETCYQELYGKKLNESEQVMLGKSESILRIRLWMREYELFAEEGAEVEALDVLIQTVNDYSKLYEYAQKWNAQGDVSVIYGQMLDILSSKYQLSEAQALEIAAEPDDITYTRAVTAAANGQGFGKTGDGMQDGAELPDMLPEEKQFPENGGGR